MPSAKAPPVPNFKQSQEADPLDAFMSTIEAPKQVVERRDSTSKPPLVKSSGEEDPLDAFMASMEKVPAQVDFRSRQNKSNFVSAAKEKSSVSKEDDPLDAFMSGLNSQFDSGSSKKRVKVSEPQWLDEGEDDDGEDFQAYLERRDKQQDDEIQRLAAESGRSNVKKEDLIFDSTGKIIGRKGRILDELPPKDHSLEDYKPYEKNIYKEHPDVAAMTTEQVQAANEALQIIVRGSAVPKPVRSFAHFSLDPRLLRVISKQGFDAPSAIQSIGMYIQ
jgi:hypothetical protein